MASVVVLPLCDEAVQRAAALAGRLDASLAGRSEPSSPDTVTPDTVTLRVGLSDLSLGTPDGTVVRAATAMLRGNTRPGRDLLRRAVGTVESGAYVLDATAGLGKDGFLLASYGLRVVMLERVPLVAMLLEDALEQAASGALGPQAATAAARVTLVHGEAITYLEASLGEAASRARPGAVAPPVDGRPRDSHGAEPADPAVVGPAGRPSVVLIDPMYPGRGKAALPEKGMALFRSLVGRDQDADLLLQAALRAATRRVVVKRPVRAPTLAGPLPSGSIRGSTTRWDIYPGAAAQPDAGVAAARTPGSRGGKA